MGRDVEFENEVEQRNKKELKEPKKYKVLLLNDDYSTMDFVVEVLMDIFDKAFDDALNIMLSVHRNGRGVCGIYTYDIAETKIEEVRKKSKESGFPLRAIMEEE